ncbi:substrate-binding domain-containing protein [Paracoccus marcusii]|uniref:substrate-binding domain-containing protein n=1 Tax=Paracoccus marcusii TaxID=59779 RepID=UPI002ED43A79|nr:substrate-binding domain-containing protein [Paracoccus marcusii]
MMNTLLKTVSAAALGFVASAGLAAAQDDTLKIGMTFQEMNNPYFVSMQEALNEAAAQIGAEVIVTDAGHDVAKQISDVEDMLQQGIDILLLNPTDSAGVEIGGAHGQRPGRDRGRGRRQRQRPGRHLRGLQEPRRGLSVLRLSGRSPGRPGEVAILDGIPVVPILQRVEGCKEALAEHEGITLVDTQNGRQDRSVALGVVENMIQSHQNLAGIFSVNDGGAMGALAAIQGRAATSS